MHCAGKGFLSGAFALRRGREAMEENLCKPIYSKQDNSEQEYCEQDYGESNYGKQNYCEPIESEQDYGKPKYRKHIYGKLNQRTPVIIRESKCHESAVCIPLVIEDGEVRVLFEQRASELADQPGDICFPGGMAEGRESCRETAVRECCEELLIKAEQVEILGASDIFFSYNVIVHPFAAVIKDYEGTYSRDEVAEVFTVPLKFFVENEPKVHTVEWKAFPEDNFPFELINGGENYKWRRQIQDEPFYIYENKVIWGITAKIVRAFAQRLSE